MAVRIVPASPEDHPALVAVWEASVRATHHFVAEDDIARFRLLLHDSWLDAVTLACARDEADAVWGFVGVAAATVEMLFVAPAHFGQGTGRRLLAHAVGALGATHVDVNEQNPQAIGFYIHCGFEITGRSPVDGLGKPYPLLHLRLRAAFP